MLRGRLLAGDLSAEAKEVAQAEMARREQAGDTTHEFPVKTPICPSQSFLDALPSRSVMKVVMGLYIAFVVLCLVVTVFDPPWGTSSNNMGAGMLGGLAIFAMGLPCDFVFASILGASRAGSNATFVFVCISGVVVNLAFFVWYFKRN
jgi:hypothetical protein